MKSKISKLPFVIFLLLSCIFSTFAQQTNRERGIELYRQSNYKAAANFLKKSVKDNEKDAESWYFLGLTYLQIEEEKNAVKAMQKAVELNPNNALMRNGLAYAYLIKNDSNGAYKEAQETIKMDSKLAEPYYILGVLAFRNGSYNSAYERAQQTLKLNPNIVSAYLLKSESLVASFTKQYGTITKTAPLRSEILKEASDDLENFLNRAPNIDNKKFYLEYLASIKFFADHYRRQETQSDKAANVLANVSDSNSSLKITSKPRALYTDAARRAGISGRVDLLVGFDADGTVKHVLILNPLGYGLNENAVRAARNIRFEPATENGKPISVVKQVQYSFMIY
jgi:TonB family protein